MFSRACNMTGLFRQHLCWLCQGGKYTGDAVK